MKKFPNILQVAGSSRNTGKTTLVCSIIKKLKHQKIVAVKTSPHLHFTTPGLVELANGDHWHIFRETNHSTRKDTSKYLQNGASESYLLLTKEQTLQQAFTILAKLLPANVPVVVESSSLHQIILPGMLIFIDNNAGKKPPKQCFIINSDGKQFFKQPNITFDKTWKIKF